MRGAVLAGGGARRYGGLPKGLLTVGGGRILDHVAGAVQTVTAAPPLLIANAPDAASWRPDLRTIPDSSGRRGLEPLCAVYGPACAPAIARRLDSGDLQAISFHADVRVGILSLAEVKAFGDPDELFFNVNTPADLARAEALSRRHG